MSAHKKSKAKVAKVKVVAVTPLEEQKHIVALEAEVHGPLPQDFNVPLTQPVEIVADDPEPVKRGFWSWLFGD